MKKTKYTRPSITKVKLNHEQAVLGTCIAGEIIGRHNAGSMLCDTACKRDRNSGNSAGTS